MLGDGSYDLYFADRGGKALIGRVNDQFRLKAQWSRDDAGQCSVTVTDPGRECCELLSSLRTVRHELVLLRNGHRVWEGPITRLGFFEDYIEIDARDVAWYFTRRVLEHGFDHTGVSVNAVDAVFDVLVAHYTDEEDQGYNIGQYLMKVSSADDARTAARHDPYSKTLFEFLNHYADNGGIDFIVRGRRVIVYDTHTRFSVLPQLSDGDFAQSLGVVEYGSELRTRTWATNNAGISIPAVAPQQWLDYYGKIDVVRNNPDEGTVEVGATTDSLLSQAERDLESGYPAPVSILVPANIGVLPTVPIDFMDLMPGAWVPIASGRTCRQLRQWQRINDTVVTIDPDGEVVSLVLDQAPAKHQEPLAARAGPSLVNLSGGS